MISECAWDSKKANTDPHDWVTKLRDACDKVSDDDIAYDEDAYYDNAYDDDDIDADHDVIIIGMAVHEEVSAIRRVLVTSKRTG